MNVQAGLVPETTGLNLKKIVTSLVMKVMPKELRTKFRQNY